MRIIAGTHRSRLILPPKDDRTTRPITDRVKQSLFDRLASMGMLGEGNVLDIFSGTGSMGLEALSRGADHCTFLERDREARELLEKNLDVLQFARQATVLSADALSLGWIGVLGRKPVRLAFCDPPYAMTLDETLSQRVVEVIAALGAAAGVMEPGGVLVLRTDDHAKAHEAAGWTGPISHGYGSMVLHFYEKM